MKAIYKGKIQSIIRSKDPLTSMTEVSLEFKGQVETAKSLAKETSFRGSIFLKEAVAETLSLGSELIITISDEIPVQTTETRTVIEATDPPPQLNDTLLGYDPASPGLVGGYDSNDCLLLVRDILAGLPHKQLSELTQEQKEALVLARIGVFPRFDALLPGMGLFNQQASLMEVRRRSEAGKKIVELDCQELDRKVYAVKAPE
jgi:hypothetical protein